MIKAIVFDLWNTLIPATIDFVHVVSLAKKEHLSLPDLIEKYEKATQLKNYNSYEELRKDFFAAFSDEPNDLLEQEIYEIYINRYDKINYFPDVEKNLLKLKKDGLKLALLSNTESLYKLKLEEKLSFKKYFDALCYSFEIGAIKPDKKAFDCPLKKLNISPSEALMVGDSLRSDIIGAQKSGMHNCLINRLGKVIDTAKAKPEFEIKSLNEIHKVVGVLNGKS